MKFKILQRFTYVEFKYSVPQILFAVLTFGA